MRVKIASHLVDEQHEDEAHNETDADNGMLLRHVMLMLMVMVITVMVFFFGFMARVCCHSCCHFTSLLLHGFGYHSHIFRTSMVMS
jgi:hypothetical protein